MRDYKRLTTNNLEEYNPKYDFCVCCECYDHKNRVCNKPFGPCANYKRNLETYNRLVELEDKIENGTLVELDESLIGQGIIGIHHFTDGTYQLDLDENIVVGFGVNGIVTWNNDHLLNDYFKNGLWFIDNDKGRAEAKAKLKELKGE